MKTTAEIIEILRDYKARSAEKYGIETLGLFGSVARGEQNEKSDIPKARSSQSSPAHCCSQPLLQ